MKLKFELCDSGKHGTLLEDYYLYNASIPVGFRTDFASIPRAFWSIFPPIGRYAGAAVIHDFMYQFRGFCYAPFSDMRTLWTSVTRKEADLRFLWAMELLGVPWWKRKIMYRAVRLFGGKAWKQGHKPVDC